MIPQTYRAASVHEAIRLAKAELGPDALILDVRRISPVIPGQSREGTVEVSAVAPPGADSLDVLLPARRFPRARQATANLAPEAGTPAAAAVRALRRLGMSPVLAERLAHASVRRHPGASVRSTLARVIAERVRFCPLPPAASGRTVMAVIGPSGAGKTTTVAKLASQFRTRGMRVAVLGLDPNPVTGILLGAWAEHLRVPHAAVRDRAELADAIAAAGRADVILIDTPGCNPYDQAQIKRLRDDLGSRDPIVCCLTLAVTGDTEELVEIGRRFQRLNPTALVVTKLDETQRAASCIGIAEQLALPLAALGTGQQVPDDLVPASAPALAELVIWTLGRCLRATSPAEIGTAHRGL